MKASALLWDNDGVLVDTEILYFEATRDIFASVGHELTQAAFVDASLRRGVSAFEAIADRFTAAEIEGLRERRNRAYHETVARGVRVNPGVRECLEIFRTRLRMGVVTGSRRDHFEVMHRTSGLLPYFEFVLTHDEYQRSKPHPEPYLMAVEHYGLDPRGCVVVEDSERGVQSAAAAGLCCIAVPNELTRGGDFSAAAAILDSVIQLPAALESLNSRW